MAEVWTQWESRTVNGVYPLRRFLNASDHSAVFLTETAAEGFLNAAIKLIPAGGIQADVQLWQWKTATTFSHPHLIRLLDWGQCELDGAQLLFVVMEYSEENLSQILPYRTLGPDEVRELLVPTLDALAVLHRENWVQGQLKPTNFLVVNDQLKLAMDTLRSAGVARGAITRPSLYDPPELEQGEISLAADIWALGVTLVEALTQYPPAWPQGKTAAPSLPANLPPLFVDVIQRCLSINPAERPTVAELQALTRPTPAPASAPAPASRQAALAPATPRTGAAPTQAPQPEPVMRAMPSHSYSSSARDTTRSDSAKRSVLGPALAAVVVVLVAVWGGLRLLQDHPTNQLAASTDQTSPQGEAARAVTPSSASTPPSEASTNAGSANAGSSSAGSSSDSSSAAPPRAQQALSSQSPAPPSPQPRSGNDNSSVVHEEIPTVSPGVRQTIHGHVRVAVRVTVNQAGNVVRDAFENASSSKYFNRVASEAARKWRFSSIDNNDRSREWLLHFEFGREGTTVHATRSRS